MAEPLIPDSAEDPDPRDDPRADPLPAPGDAFVPPSFTPPPPPRTDSFWLEPLGERHNAADYAAWTSSMEHIKATPGFQELDWPQPMSIEENAEDLRMHADHFERRVGFTYTVRSTSDDDVIGCVYIYPSGDPEMGASVRSWVRSSHAALDGDLWRAVSDWLRGFWPFGDVDYAPR